MAELKNNMNNNNNTQMASTANGRNVGSPANEIQRYIPDVPCRCCNSYQRKVQRDKSRKLCSAEDVVPMEQDAQETGTDDTGFRPHELRNCLHLINPNEALAPIWRATSDQYLRELYLGEINRPDTVINRSIPMEKEVLLRPENCMTPYQQKIAQDLWPHNAEQFIENVTETLLDLDHLPNAGLVFDAVSDAIDQLRSCPSAPVRTIDRVVQLVIEADDTLISAGDYTEFVGNGLREEYPDVDDDDASDSSWEDYDDDDVENLRLEEITLGLSVSLEKMRLLHEFNQSIRLIVPLHCLRKTKDPIEKSFLRELAQAIISVENSVRTIEMDFPTNGSNLSEIQEFLEKVVQLNEAVQRCRRDLYSTLIEFSQFQNEGSYVVRSVWNKLMHALNGNRKRYTMDQWAVLPSNRGKTKSELRQSYAAHSAAEGAKVVKLVGSRTMRNGRRNSSRSRSRSGRSRSSTPAPRRSVSRNRRNTEYVTRQAIGPVREYPKSREHRSKPLGDVNSYLCSLLDPWNCKGAKIPDITTYPSSVFSVEYEFPFTVVPFFPSGTALATVNGSFILFTPDISQVILQGVPALIGGGFVLAQDGVPNALPAPNVAAIANAYSAIRPVSFGIRIRNTGQMLTVSGRMCMALWPSTQSFPFPGTATVNITYDQFQEFLKADCSTAIAGMTTIFRPIDDSAFLYHRKTEAPFAGAIAPITGITEFPFFAPGDMSTSEAFYAVDGAAPFDVATYTEYAFITPWRGCPAIGMFITDTEANASFVAEICINYEAIPDQRTWSLVMPTHSPSRPEQLSQSANVMAILPSSHEGGSEESHADFISQVPAVINQTPPSGSLFGDMVSFGSDVAGIVGGLASLI